MQEITVKRLIHLLLQYPNEAIVKITDSQGFGNDICGAELFEIFGTEKSAVVLYYVKNDLIEI